LKGVREGGRKRIPRDLPNTGGFTRKKKRGYQSPKIRVVGPEGKRIHLGRFPGQIKKRLGGKGEIINPHDSGKKGL